MTDKKKWSESEIDLMKFHGFLPDHVTTESATEYLRQNAEAWAEIRKTPHRWHEERIDPPLDPEDFDEWYSDEIQEHGEVVAAQEFPDGSYLKIYKHNGMYYLFRDDGLAEYDDLYTAMRQNGFEVNHDS